MWSSRSSRARRSVVPSEHIPESASPIEVVGDVVDRLAAAGIAPEAMCFSDFPSETRGEAIATVRWLDARRDRLGLFIVGEFGLTHGSLVAQRPAQFGLAETWQVDGDELGLGLFFREAAPAKTARDRDAIDHALDHASRRFELRGYPWAGAVSTAHTPPRRAAAVRTAQAHRPCPR